MGTFKRIQPAQTNSANKDKGTAKTGGSFVRIATGERITAPAPMTEDRSVKRKTPASTANPIPTTTDLSGEAWTRATASQTKIPAKSRLSSPTPTGKTSTSTTGSSAFSKSPSRLLSSAADVQSTTARVGGMALPRTVDAMVQQENAERAERAENQARADQARTERVRTGQQTFGDRVYYATDAALNSTVASIIDATRAVTNAYLDPDFERRQIASMQKDLAAGKSSDGKTLNAAQRKTIEAAIAKHTENIPKYEEIIDRAASKADDFARKAESSQTAGKDGLGTVGRLAFDAGVAGVQMLGDAAVNAVIPGSGLWAMGVRSFGGGTQEARQNGASIGQQLTAGAATAAVEVGTEKMFDGLSGLYGKGEADEVVKEAIKKMTKSVAGRKALETVAGFGGEAIEEGVSGILAPLIQRIYDDEALGQYFDPEFYADIGHDMLVGGILGGVGTGTNVLLRKDAPVEQAVTQQIAQPRQPITPQQQTETAAPVQEQTAQSGRPMSNSEAERILSDPARLREMGVELRDDMTRSQKRQAVKEAARRAQEATQTQRQTERETAQPRVETAQSAPESQEARVRRVFGKQGNAVADMMLERGQDREAYFTDFSEYYKAGVLGQDVSTANPVYGDVLSPIQQQAAYKAGMNDLAENLKAQKARAKAAEVAKNGGMTDEHYNYAVEKYGQKAADRINQTARKLKTQVAFADQLKGNGEISGSTILIGKDVDPFVALAGHELTHRGQDLAPEQYSAFRDAVASIPDMADRVSAKQEMYHRQGVNLTYEQALDEVAADYGGQLMQDTKVLEEFIQKNQTNRSLLEWLRDLFREIADTLTGKNRANAKNAERLLSKTLDEAARQAERNAKNNTAQEGGETRYSFVGERARTADKSSLEQAKAMQADGKSNEEIRQATGWFRGMDGKWRFEIDDSKITVNLEAAKNRVYGLSLEDLIDAPELFAAYPDMRYIGVDITPTEKGVNGQYNRQFDEITLSRKLLDNSDDLLDALVHELQHAVQQREGFTPGGTVAGWQRKMDNGFDSRTAKQRRELAEYQQQYKEIQQSDPTFFKDMEELDAMSPNVPRGEITNWDTLEAEPDPPEWVAYDAKRDALEEKYGDKVLDFIDLKYHLDHASQQAGRTATDLYYDTAGEIEARDTASRRGLNDQQRKEKAPNLGNEDTVFANGQSRTSHELVGYAADGTEVYETSDAVKQLTNKERMTQFLQIMQNEYAGRTARFVNGDGEVQYAKFDQTDLQKNVYGDKKSTLKGWKAKIKVGADGGIFNLVENSRFDGSKAESGKPTAAHKNVNGWEYYIKTVQIDGTVFDVLANIRKRSDGEFVYSIQMRENKNTKASPVAVFANQQSSVNVGKASSVDSLSQNAEDVKRYSLKDVDPIEPSDDRWKRGATFAEVKAAHPTLFALEADEAETRNPTQITGTVKSYRKIYDALKSEGFNGTILDASSGLGYGTKAGIEEYGFNVDDIEPFPDAKYKPKYTDYSKLHKTYDVIINNAVLNVIPQDLRDALVVKMGEMLNPGGRAFINVRGTDVKNASSKVAINEELMEYFISNTGSYQKGFTPKELVAYLQDALGDGFTVEPTKKFGAVSAIVTKDGGEENVRYSLQKGSEGRKLTEAQAEYFKDSAIRDDDDNLLLVHHATDAEFTVFDKAHGGENTDGNAADPYIAATARLGHWFNTQDLKGRMYTEAPTLHGYLNIKNPYEVSSLDALVAELWDGVTDFDEFDYTAEQLDKIAQDYANALQTRGFDGIVLRDEEFGGKSFIVFDSNQFKRADNQNPSEDPDIRRSLKGTEATEDAGQLWRQNQRLEAQVSQWQRQTQRTTDENRTVRQADVDKMASRLVKGYGSTLKGKDISADLKALGEYIVRGKDLSYQEAHGRAMDIARKIVESAQVKNDEAFREYKDLRDYLRTTPMTISAQDVADLYMGYNEFRQATKGKIRLSRGENSNIDRVYTELSERWPEFFDQSRENHPADMLERMADVLDGIQPITENPYSADIDAATQYAANEILESILGEDVRQAAPTFADRQAAKLDAANARTAAAKQDARDAKAAGKAAVAEAKARGREAVKNQRLADDMYYGRKAAEAHNRAQAALERANKAKQEQVQRLKDHYKQVRENQTARRADSKARTRLLHIAQRLKNRKLPAVNRALLNQYIGELDTVAKSMTGKTLERLTELEKWYKSQQESDDFIRDPKIEKRLERLSQKHISDMTNEEVADLTQVLLHIENEINNQHKLIGEQERRDTYHLGEETIRNIRNTKGSRGNPIDRYIVTETLSPVRMIRRLTGYVDSDPLLKLTNALADGQRKQMEYQMRAERPFSKFAQDKAFSDNFSGKKATSIEIKGKSKTTGETVTVTITPAMRVALYLHSLNDQNMRHIADGGVVIPDAALYRKGDMAEAYARGTRIALTPSQVRAITGGMTAQERAFAQAAHKYFNETSREAINATSEQLKGYSIADVENYFPINASRNFTKAEFESILHDSTIEGMGFLQERTNSKNPILLRDANAVLDQAIQMHGKYVGLAIPVRNFNKVWNVITGEYLDDGSRNGFTGSVAEAISQQWGTDGANYVEKFMNDLQNGQKAQTVWGKALPKVRSSYAGAVLTMNMSVAMKQAASYPTAAAVLGWKPLGRALADVGQVNLATIEKYTPLQWYRSKGFSSVELGDMASNNRQLPKALNWVQGADLLTTRKLWKASEYYVREHNKALAIGSEAYYQEVANIYNRVIEETQPNYTTMQRPQLLRSDDSLMANLAMFKTQPFQNFNVLYDAAENYMAKKARGENTTQAKTDLSNAVTSQLAQLATFAAMTMAWGMLRGKDDKYRDKDGEKTVASIAKGLARDMIGGAFSMLPFGSDVWDWTSAAIFKERYYGMDVVTTTAIEDTLSSLKTAFDVIGDTAAKLRKHEDVNWLNVWIKTDSVIDTISKAFGKPYENVANLVNMVYRQVSIATLGKYRGEYAAMKLTTSTENTAKYYTLLWRAMRNDQSQYAAVYQDMVDDGFDPDKIKSAMESRMKTAQGVTKSSELEQRYLPPEQQTAYDSAHKTLAASSIWSKATEEQRKNAEDDLYTLLSGSKTGNKMQERIDGGKQYGLTETEYILYNLALEMVDEPNSSGELKTYSKGEKQNAAKMAGLNKNETKYLTGSK